MNSKADDELIVLATFDTSHQAHLLRNELELSGIEARIANEESASSGLTMGGPSSAFWVEVLVLKSDANAALVIKQEFLAKPELIIREWVCMCGETVDAGFAVCWSCSKPHPFPPE